MPSVPPAAKHPVASEPEYLNLFNSGNATWPIIAAVASDDPLMAPNPAHPPTDAMATPPLKCPSHR